MSSTATTAEPVVTTIESVLSGVKGLGSSTIGKALDALDYVGSAQPDPAQLARAADANAGKQDGLKGKALAMWVITGADSAKQAEMEKARHPAAGQPQSQAGPHNRHSPAPKPPEFTWPKKQAEILLDYLKAEVTGDADAPNKGAPFINSKGIVRFTGTHWREWLTKQGMNPTKNQAGEPVREAGMKMRPFALPGEGRQLGFYTGPAPKGTASLPRRVVERAARGTGGGSTRKPANPFAKFNPEQIAYLRTVIARGRKGEVRDALCDLLAAMPEPGAPAPEPTTTDEERAAASTLPEAEAAEAEEFFADTGAEPAMSGATDAIADAPQEPASSEAGDTSPEGADAPQAAA